MVKLFWYHSRALLPKPAFISICFYATGRNPNQDLGQSLPAQTKIWIHFKADRNMSRGTKADGETREERGKMEGKRATER